MIVEYGEAARIAHETAFQILKDKGELNSLIGEKGLKEVIVYTNEGREYRKDFAFDAKGIMSIGKNFNETNFKNTGLKFTVESSEKFGAIYAGILSSRVNCKDYKDQKKNVNPIYEDRFAREAAILIFKNYNEKISKMSALDLFAFGSKIARSNSIPYFKQPIEEGITTQDIEKSLRDANEKIIHNAGKEFSFNEKKLKAKRLIKSNSKILVFVFGFKKIFSIFSKLRRKI